VQEREKERERERKREREGEKERETCIRTYVQETDREGERNA